VRALSSSGSSTLREQVDALTRRIAILDQTVRALQEQVAELTKQLEASRAQPQPQQPRRAGPQMRVGYSTLLQALQTELVEADKATQKQTEGPTSYVVSEFNLSIKALAELDEKGKPILVFPTPGEADPSQLSSLSIRLSPVPRFAPQPQPKGSSGKP